MELESIGDQRHPDQQQEGERQHLGGGMLGDEISDRPRRRIHHEHGDHHGRDHHLEVIRHADRGDDRIEREDEVDRDQLQDDPGEGLAR